MLNEAYFVELAAYITAVSLCCIAAVAYSYIAVNEWRRYRRRRA